MTTITLPPAALTAAAAPELSSRYVHVDTRAVVAAMEADGWIVAAAEASRPRTRDPLYARHMIDFRRPEFAPVLGAKPRILFTNSHDGTTAARARAGFFRYVCSNGLVVGTETGRVAARHSGHGPLELVHEMNALAECVGAQSEAMLRWEAKGLTAAQRDTYARLVGQLRWGNAWAYDPAQILKVRRAEDDSGTLFSAFNRAQENTVRGGLRGISPSGRGATSRPLTDIGRDIGYNAALWTLTEELCGFW